MEKLKIPTLIINKLNRYFKKLQYYNNKKAIWNNAYVNNALIINKAEIILKY